MTRFCRQLIGARHHPSRRREGAGFSIIEFLIYLAILALALTAAVSISANLVASRAKSVALYECDRNADLAASRLTSEIREASDINLGDSTFDVSPSRISLATSNPLTDPTVFSVSSGRLFVQQGAGPNLPLTSSQVTVTEFTLTDLSLQHKVKAIAIRLKVSYRSDLEEYAADSVIETTAQVKKSDGYGN